MSDFLSINCPSSPETVRFLDAERIAMLPEGAFVVNTARGQHRGRRGAHRGPSFAAGSRRAGLDVFDNEPNLHPGYLDLDNVFMLPHVGSATHETRTAMGDTCLANLAAYFAGPPLPPGPHLTALRRYSSDAAIRCACRPKPTRCASMNIPGVPITRDLPSRNDAFHSADGAMLCDS